MDEKILISRSTLADRLDVNVRTIERWEKDGLPTIKIRQTVRYDFEDVEKWMKSK